MPFFNKDLENLYSTGD